MTKIVMRSLGSTAVAVLVLILAAAARPSGASHAESAPQVSPAVDGVLALFQRKPVVALGDAHGLAQEDEFYSTLIRDPRFAQQVGNVVVEFGGESAQDTIDRYVSGEQVPFAQLRRVWTDVVGWFPGESANVGFVNFFAAVRAANLKLPPGQRIKVWLGDPKIDWAQTRSFQDVQPLLRKRDDNLARIVSAEILNKHKKTLLIVGLGHLFGPGGTGPLSARINETAPGALAIVAPFLGYLEPQCNAKFVAQATGWPTPAIAGPIAGTALKSQLQLPGCNYVPPAQVERMKKMAASGPSAGRQLPGPGGPPPFTAPGAPAPPGGAPAGGRMLLGSGKAPSPTDILAAEIDILSGVKADAILYLGPPERLTQSPLESSVYLDLDYFKELSRRSQCCTPGGRPLDWDEMLQQGSGAARRFEIR
jgi:hypothetical protein